jgi:molecular chaperone GrpE
MPQDIDDSSANEQTSSMKSQDDGGAEDLLRLSPEELVQKIAEAEQKANQHWERLLRLQAEADNTARRVERDIAHAHKFALERFVNELLPIIDSLELCVTSVPKEMRAAAEPVIDGVKLTLKMFYTSMEKFGVQQVNPVSEVFNPEYQQAISTQVDTSVPPGTVISVLQKGYTLNKRLIRPALVTVSKAEE